MHRSAMLMVPVVAAALAACNSTVRLKGDKNEPIHVVMDINIRLDKQLDQFFDFEGQPAPGGAAPAAASTNQPTEVRR